MKRDSAFHFSTGHVAVGTLVMAFAMAQPASAAGDAARGQALFKQKCSVCHSVTPGAPTTMGPNLSGAINRKAGSTTFTYSPALKASGLKWDIATLDVYLTAPRKKVPGTRMVIAVPDANDRADLIAYLGTQAGKR